MKKIFIQVILLFSILTSYAQVKRHYELPAEVSESAYHPSIIIVKLNSEAIGKTSSSTRGTGNLLDQIANTVSAKSVSEVFSRSVTQHQNTRSGVSHPLSNIYKVEINSNTDILASVNKLLTMDEVAYAEPYFAHQTMAVPNDPNANPTSGQQPHLSVIRAYDAWSIEKGDTNVVIGILDTGLQSDHPDLVNSIAYNYDDPINGVDDDNDGLIDNFVGWDIADNDNNPTADTDPHGTEMSGISAATTDNFAGMAGVGYRSKFMPIKIFKSGSNFFFGGYEAIALAADLGCDVINLSWGSPNSFSQFGQDVINYAVLDRDVAIVAAAGNDRQFDNFYPASFDNVLSVSATDLGDQRAFFSTYSYNVDLSAPGVDIYATTNGKSYIFRSGTSEASAITAGALALVRARFPEFTGQQAMEKVRINTDEIYNIGNNIDFDGQLGSGRLNMLKALEVNNLPSLRIIEKEINNGSGEYVFFGDTLTISTTLRNFLSPTSNAQIHLTSTSPYVEILEADWSLGQLNTLEKTSNYQIPFKVKLADNLPPNEEIVFRLTMEDGAYQDFQHFIITSSPPRLDVDNGQLALTVTSDGDLGYDEERLEDGNGFKYLDQRILDNLGLVLAANESTVYDNAPTSFFLNRMDSDFQTVENVKLYRNSEADVDARMIFSESPTGNPVDLRIEQSTLGWNNTDYLVMEYRIINEGEMPLDNLHTSILADWNINDRDFNIADWDPSLNLGYVHSFNNDTLYAGIALITDQAPIYSAINNKNFNGNSADVPSILTDEVKYNLSINGTSNTQAGDKNSGNDVSHLVGGTIANLDVNDAEKVTLVIVTGPTLQSLRDAVVDAKARYLAYQLAPPVLEIFPTCQDESIVIDPLTGENFDFYDSPDLSNLITSGASFTTPPVSDEITYYAVNRDAPFESDVRRIIARVKPLDIGFDISPSILLLDETGKSRVDFTDNTTDAVEWSWDFGNGFTGTVQNPLMNYPEVGFYDITLQATSDIGCVGSTTQSLQVANRSNLPDIDDQLICKSEEVILSASNATNLEIYSDESLTNLVFTGQPFQTGLINQDTIFYVISADSTFQSNVQEVNILLSDIRADFINTLDTVDLSSATLMHLENNSENEVFYFWTINGNVSGINQPITFDYSDLGSFETKLIAEDINGCLDTLTTTIMTPASSTPADASFDLCEGENGSVNAASEEFYVFYSDETKQSIIKKGRSLDVQNITSDTSIFFTNIQDFGESSLSSVTFNVSDIEALFSLNSDVINAVNQTSITPNNNSNGATNWEWYINDELVSEEQNPTLPIGTPDDYAIRLTVSNNIGCIDTFELPFQVFTITGIQDFNSELTVYPNPTRNIFQIDAPENITYALIDLNGVTITEGSGFSPKIDLSQQSSGIYLLKVIYQGETGYRKIIKQD